MIPTKIIINILHIALFAPVLLAISIYANIHKNELDELMFTRFITGFIGAGIIIYHGYKWYNTSDGLYVFHIGVGIAILLASIFPTIEGFLLVGGIGIAAAVYHSYRIYLKTRPEEESSEEESSY